MKYMYTLSLLSLLVITSSAFADQSDSSDQYTETINATNYSPLYTITGNNDTNKTIESVLGAAVGYGVNKFSFECYKPTSALLLAFVNDVTGLSKNSWPLWTLDVLTYFGSIYGANKLRKRLVRNSNEANKTSILIHGAHIALNMLQSAQLKIALPAGAAAV